MPVTEHLSVERLRRMHATIVDLLALSDGGGLHQLGIHLDGSRLAVLEEINRREVAGERG